MSVNKLSAAQSAIVNHIYNFARQHGLSNDWLSHELGMNGDTIEAIPDGIYSAERYLAASKRILWVLKEPYDEIAESGMPCGGGWCIYEAFDNANAWSNRTWQPMIYASYGILHGIHYKDMDWIRDDRSMAEVLKDIAYINISKMPGFTNSNDADIQRYYDLWRPILLEQIQLYRPQVIIFGNTFKYFKQDLIGNGAQPFLSLTKEDGGIYQNNYRMGDAILIDAYHPNQKMVTREKYVEGIIEACK